MWKRILLIASLAAWIFIWFSHRSIGGEAGMLALAEPRQEPVAGVKTFRHGDFTLTPLAAFAIEARVLGAKHYLLGREADLAPYDLALGWGRMSDSKVLAEIKISQSNRFYHWSTRSCPIPMAEIIRSSANMHIIPADAAVMSKLHRLRKGHVVSLAGYLVMAQGEDGFLWVSSTTRTDSGDGACEIIWVKDIEYF